MPDPDSLPGAVLVKAAGSGSEAAIRCVALILIKVVLPETFRHVIFEALQYGFSSWSLRLHYSFLATEVWLKCCSFRFHHSHRIDVLSYGLTCLGIDVTIHVFLSDFSWLGPKGEKGRSMPTARGGGL